MRLWTLEARTLPADAALPGMVAGRHADTATGVLTLLALAMLVPHYGWLALLLAFPLARLLVLDATCYLLPNLYTLPLIAGGVVYALLQGHGNAALLAVALLLLMREVCLRIKTPCGLCGGDFTLLAALFSWMPLPLALMAVAVGSLMYLPVAFIFPARPVPFGVPLVAGWLVVALLSGLPWLALWPI